jgi:cellulose synthase/poly-beta-1,6-N-acetylglucosamine synthase-like glycosyltransferase
MIAFFYKKDHKNDLHTPSVSFIIAAFNEEKVILKKILNTQNLNYPQDKIEIIIVTDGSTDATFDIANVFTNQGILTIHQPQREGKTAALNRAVAISKNEILVFSDANSIFRNDAIKKLVRNFSDIEIGGVSGQKSILDNSKRQASIGDKLYWKYESKLKSAESKLGSIPGADGEIFAIRRNLYSRLSPQIINDDLAITLNIITLGSRVIYDHEAIAEEEASITLRDDFNVKARMVCGSLQIISSYRKILNPFTSIFGLQFFLHKTLRYFMWLMLLLLFIINVSCFSDHLFFKIFLELQIIFYVLAIVGYLTIGHKNILKIFYLPYYYCNVNIAAFFGFIFYLKERSLVEIWKKAER